MIVIYTFDFKQHVPSQNREYIMLGVSIQSLLESDANVTILLYTSDDELRRRIAKDFPMVQMRNHNKAAYCETKYFTCAGHARIETIKDVLREFQDDVLYMDNDTVVYPNGVHNLKMKTHPMGYAEEPWNSIAIWFGDNKCYRQETARLYGKNMLDSSIINNGVQYFPYSLLSLEIADDMAAFSIVMRDHQLQDHVCFKDQVSDTVWHTYMFKYKYLDNLEKIGVHVDKNGHIHGHHNIYTRLTNARNQGM
jgi:hypothetical protein